MSFVGLIRRLGRWRGSIVSSCQHTCVPSSSWACWHSCEHQHRCKGSWAARGSNACINLDPREFEECIAECTGIVVNKVYIKISLIKDCLKPFWWDNIPCMFLGIVSSALPMAEGTAGIRSAGKAEKPSLQKPRHWSPGRVARQGLVQSQDTVVRG